MHNEGVGFDQPVIQISKLYIFVFEFRYILYDTIQMYFKMEFIPVMSKLNFQQPLLQSSVSHDPSEIILICCFCA